MTALRVRPTIRCLRDDLAIAKLPPADQPLDRIDHPILRKANASFSTADAPGERIAAIDDRVLFKVKIQRWRGALWRPIPEQWLVAAGRREAGSPDDFYAELAARSAVAGRSQRRAWSPRYDRHPRGAAPPDRAGPSSARARGCRPAIARL